jgi:hypothetical protein
MLQPTLLTFGASKRAYFFVIAGAAIFGFISWGIAQGGGINLVGWMIVATGAGLTLFLLHWLSSIRVGIHPDGISWVSSLKNKEMRWEEVRSLYYHATKMSVNFIPVGTYYNFKLVGQDGQKLRLGNSVEKPAEVGAKLIEMTMRALLKPTAEKFDRGEELDFGPIKLSRGSGFSIKRTFRTVEIPLQQVVGYRIEGGNFYIFKAGDKFGTGTALG